MQVTKFNLVTDLQIMLSNVTHSNFYFECNTERGSLDQLYIELGLIYMDRKAQGLIGDGLSLEPVGTFQATYNKNTLEIHTNHQKIA